MTTSTTVTAVSVVPFDEFSPRYRCCCGCCHVRCGAFIIAILQAFELVSILSKLGNAANHFDRGDVTFADYVPTILSAVYFACYVVCVIYLFLGLCKGRSSYLTPMMIMLLFIIGFYLIATVFVVVVLAAGSDSLVDYVIEQLRIHDGSTEHDRNTLKAALKITMIALVLALLFGALIEIWWYTVIKACRTYLRDKEDWLLHHPGAQYVAPGGPGDVNVVLISQQPVSPTATTQYYPTNPLQSDDHQQFANAPPSYNDAMKSEKITQQLP